jgi:glycosyltransferase involved in cell wall biosynthesis
LSLHVLQVTPRYSPNIGGVETVVQKISETLAAHGIKVTVYSFDLSPALSQQQNLNGVRVKRFSPIFGDPFYVPEPRFVTSLRREKADIIHVHNVHTLLPFLVSLLKHRRQKLVLQSHYHRFGQSSFRDSLLKLYRYGLDYLVFSRAEAIIVNSVYEKRMICEDFSELRNVLLIPEGVDVEEAKQVEHRPVEPKRILYVGALRRYKNVDKVIEGFALLNKKTDEKFELVIVGEGQERQSLTSLARNLGVNNLIEWKHNLSRQQLLQEYAKASAFIILSPLESFSRVVYEALLVGVPAVVLNSGVMTHLVEDGIAEGVNSLDPEEIAVSLVKATRKSYPKIPESPCTFLGWKAYSNKIISIYRRLVQEHQR